MKVQVKASELSGRELDRWVSRVIGLFMESALSMEALSRQTNQLTYDRRWDAVGYLMQKYNIGLAPPSATQPLWTAYEAISGAVQRSDDAKLAVLRCLVASRLGDVFTDDNPERRVSIDYQRNRNLDPLPARPRVQASGSPASASPCVTPGNLPPLPGDLPDSWI